MDLTKEHPGNTELYFKVSDPETKMTVDMISRPVKLSVGQRIDFLFKGTSGTGFPNKLVIVLKMRFSIQIENYIFICFALTFHYLCPCEG